MNENTEEKNYLENLNEPEEKELFEESDNLDVPEQYREMEDGELVRLAETDEMALEYLLNKYKYFVRAKARSYFLIGADREDLVQEGMIGLYKAIRDYRADKLCTFHAFAELCITRQIITAIKTATRQKHLPLNSYVSLNKPLYEEESDRTLLDVITSARSQNPEELMINAENRTAIEGKIQELLSDLEREVLASYLDEKSYQQIADELQRHVKSIDNALQRVKRKLEKHLYADDAMPPPSLGSTEVHPSHGKHHQ